MAVGAEKALSLPVALLVALPWAVSLLGLIGVLGRR